MKSTNYIINGVLAIAVIILFILQFSGKKTSVKEPVLNNRDSCATLLPVAYINSDSLLLNYNFAIDLNDALMSKVEKSRAVINQKAQQLSAEMVEFENKVNNNIFLTRERAIAEQQRLEKKQRDLQELMARSQEEMGMEQARVNQQLTDTVLSVLAIFNSSKKYQIIFNNTLNDNVLLANDAYNITKEILDFLNGRYKPDKK